MVRSTRPGSRPVAVRHGGLDVCPARIATPLGLDLPKPRGCVITWRISAAGSLRTERLVAVDEVDDLDEQLDRVLIGGREVREVRIAPYSEEWPRRFELERIRIKTALGPTARGVEHIGSTAVPGLAAKPIIDILVTVDDPDDTALVAALEGVGYRLRVQEEGHRMFRTPECDVHVHVWTAGSDEERGYLLFRDRLRSHRGDRQEYERTKRALAGEWRDVNYYARAKSPVVDHIMERARRAALEPTVSCDSPTETAENGSGVA